MRPPLLSAFDPVGAGEGSIDPLGLAPVYERLADRMLPAVTVRMGRPRFLTAIAAGAHVCQAWPIDTVAADQRTPPWLVFEWFVIEALCHERQALENDGRIPGILKAQRAMNERRPLSAHAYLKTPSVFGFTGIFRRLARALGILAFDGRLDEAGNELLVAWSKEHGLDGFIAGDSGAGATFRAQLHRAVAQGLENGHTTPQSREFRSTIARTLGPARLRGAERKVLLRLLIDRAGPPHMVAEISDAMVKRNSTVEAAEEAAFLRVLSKRAGAEFKELLAAIEAYERLCGLLVDAFDWIRHEGGKAQGACVGHSEFRGNHIDVLLGMLEQALGAIESHPSLIGWEPSLAIFLDRFRDIVSAEQFYDALLAHHEAVQKDKPPDGKRAWFERDRNERIFIRPNYVLETAPLPRERHVHEYRIPTFSRFLSDLGAFA